MMLATYRAVTTLGKPLIEALLRRRSANGKEDPERAPERRGVASRPRPAGKLVWVHAASVGESVSVLPLINALHDLYPACHFLVTTGTVTSARLMAERLPERAFHQYIPVDRRTWVERFCDHWRPDIALWVESEFWPNLLTIPYSRGVPMILVNARISPRSYRNWRRFPAAIRPLLRCFSLCLAQSDPDAEKLVAMGAPNVVTPGNLKFAAAPLPADPDALNALQDSLGSRPVWLAASTHDGEDAAVIAAHEKIAEAFPDILTIIVPRHPVRGGAIAALAEARNLTAQRRATGDAPGPETDIYIADTVGELGLFYRVAPVSFIAGSLIPHGGQNMLEAARLDSAILFGPHTVNFKLIAEAMLEAGAAISVKDADALAENVARLLRDGAARTAQTTAAQRIATEQQNVLDRVIEQIVPFLQSAAEGKNDAAA